MIPIWPKGTQTEKFTDRKGNVYTVPLIQLNTGAPLPFAVIPDLDICILWATAQMAAAPKEDYVWWEFYKRLVVRFRNSIGKPTVPWTKAQLQVEWDRRIKELKFLQAATRDAAIANGVDPTQAWANYNAVVLMNSNLINTAYEGFIAKAKT